MPTPFPEQPLRLLHVSPSFYPAHEYGGPVVSLYQLCLAQRRAGRSVRVLTSTAGLTPARPQPLVGWVDEFGVPTYYAPVRLPPDLAPGMVPQLVVLSRWAQVVHITGVFSAASVLALLTALTWSRGRAVVLSPRGALLPWALLQSRGRARKQQFLTALAPLLRRVHGWHVTSEEEAVAVRAVLQNLGQHHANIHIVAPGVVGAEDPAHDHIARHQRPPGQQLLVLGRVHPVKNIELAIDALALLRRDWPQATLVIAGPVADAGYAAELKARVTALGLREAVSWTGLVTGGAKQQLLAGSAVLWLGSHMESFGNVVVEALAVGTPVVATQTTPWQQLESAAVGRWVPPTPADLVAATRELFTSQNDSVARQQLAARCRTFAASHFSWQQAERRMYGLYLSALGRVTAAF